MKKNVFCKKLFTIVITICMLSSVITIINVRAASPPVIDGVITSGEYAEALYIPLKGPWPPIAPFPPQTVDCYVYWDAQYLWIAVDEPVPNWGSATHDNFIEFMWDPGPSSPNLHAWVLWDSGWWSHVVCPKWGCWYQVADPFPGTSWWSVGTATEFKFDYTLYGTSLGGTIKLVVDTSEDAHLYPPFGDCQIWPPNPTYYPCESPSSVATWGSIVLNGNQPPIADGGGPYSGLVGEDIVLDGSDSSDIDGTIVSYEWDLDDDGFYDDAAGVMTTYSWSSEGTYTVSLKVTDDDGLFDTDDAIINIGDHAVDGVISPGEYDGGMAVQLIGELNPSLTIDAYIDWDAQFLYVGVNESVPSWIEFCFDAGSHRAFYDAFALFSSGSISHVICPKASGTWSGDSYIFSAFYSTSAEFKVDYTDFGIALGDTIKMSIDRGMPAAYWPAGAIVYTAPGRRPDVSTWGDVTLCVLTENIPVSIDIKPGSYPNSININSKGRVPVAILTDEDFDAANVNSSTIMFLDANPVHSALEDVDDDGDMDMIFHFKTQNLDFSLVVDEGSEYPYAYLSGETFSGDVIGGKDTVSLIGQYILFQHFFLQRFIQRFILFKKILNQII